MFTRQPAVLSSAGFGYNLNRAGLLWGVSEFLGLNHFAYCVNVTEHIALKIRKYGVSVIHSEISKVLEHERKGRTDEAENGLVSCLVHIASYARMKEYDLEGAYVDKMAYNATRKDHTHEARRIAGGKQF